MTLSPTTCRICLQTDSRTTNIFSTYSPPDGSATAASAISRYAFVQVLQDDGLPQGICNVCQTELHRTLLFIKLCEKSDKKLRTNCQPQEKFSDVDEPPAPAQLVQIKEIPPILTVCSPVEETKPEQTVIIKEEYNPAEEEGVQNEEFEKEFYNDISKAMENKEEHLNFVDVKDIQEDVDMSSDEGMLEEQNFEEEGHASVQMDLEVAMHYRTNQNTLSKQSQQFYGKVYMDFMTWQKTKGLTSFSEQVFLKYFEDLSQKYKPPSLSTYFSILRTRLLKHNVDISKYEKLRALLKTKSVGYKTNPSKSFTAQEINRFLDEAPDSKYLCAKVVLIMGVLGAFTNNDLAQMTVDDVEDLGYAAVITIRNSNTFTITKKVYEIYKKYVQLRPKELGIRRLFLNYHNFQCTRQPIGVNKIGGVPLIVAQFLGLQDLRMYTGNSLRRTSGSLRINKTGYFSSVAKSRGN